MPSLQFPDSGLGRGRSYCGGAWAAGRPPPGSV